MTRPGRAAFLALFGLCACGPGWTDGQRIEAGTPEPGRFFYFNPKIAAAGTVFGTATAIWTASLRELHASHLGPGWGAPAAFADHRSFRHAHAVAAAPDGSAIGVFTTSTGLSWARHASGAWSSAASLGETGSWPSISADRDGNMVAVWTTGPTLRAARYLVASGWQPAESLGTADAVTSPDVSVSPSGHAVAAWCERRGDGTSWVVANRFVPTSGWTGATALGTVPRCLTITGTWSDFAGDPATVDTAIDELNFSAVLWTNGAIQFQRYARRFDGTSAWTAPLALTSGTDATNPQIAVNRDGDAMAAWQTADATILQADRYSAEFDRWGGVTTLYSATPAPPNIAVGMDSAQHGMVGYLDERQRVTMRSYDGARFGSPQAISEIGSYEFDMAMTADGQACAVWAARQIDVFTATFSP